jgi:AcrR family transcriptional regulator
MTAARGTAARRTQKERREGTIRKILDAATDTLIDHGYAEASVGRICERAGVSQGALFRHFPSREELMVAVGEDIGARTLDAYRKKVAKNTSIVDAVELIRHACRSRLNAAWYELQLAARTNEHLRRALEPVSRRYYEHIIETARELKPEAALKLGPMFDLVVTSIIALFDGETTHRFLVRDEQLEEARLGLLVRAVQSVL